MKCAPNMSKLCSEVPNSVRGMLGLVKKHSNSKFSTSKGLHKIPPALGVALEKLLMDHILAGEEVTLAYASSVCNSLIELWNEQVEALVKSVGEQKLAQADSSLTSGANSTDRAAVAQARAAARSTVVLFLYICVAEMDRRTAVSICFRTSGLLYSTVLYCRSIVLQEPQQHMTAPLFPVHCTYVTLRCTVQYRKLSCQAAALDFEQALLQLRPIVLASNHESFRQYSTVQYSNVLCWATGARACAVCLSLDQEARAEGLHELGHQVTHRGQEHHRPPPSI